MTPPTPSRTPASIEVAALTALLLTYIWVWQGTFAGSSLLIIVLYFGLAGTSQLRRRETPRQLGLRFDNVPAALRNAAVVVVPIAAVFLAVGAALGTWHFPSWKRVLSGLPWLLAWDLAQQYGLLCFFYRHFLEIMGRPGMATLAASITFAGFHAPNPFLMVVTLGGGAVACALYRRAPNLLVIGIAHAALSYVLYFALPFGLTHGLRVGPGYYSVAR